MTPKVVISQAGVLDLVAAYEANLGQGAVRDFLGSSVAGRPGSFDHKKVTNVSPYRLYCQIQYPSWEFLMK